MHDIVIKGATVVDGQGNAPFRGDIGIKDGRIASIAANLNDGDHVVDAEGLHLGPGLVDVHTHYDAQVTWDPTLSPSSSLGVTTVVTGNCGFGIVPCPPPAPETLMRNLSVVEGMDLDALRAGVRWQFQSFAEYAAFVQKQAPYLNVATLVGHSTIRTAIMGDEASERKVPSETQLSAMKDAVRSALRSGAIGFASSFSPNHGGYGGVPMPSTIAELPELQALTNVMDEEGKGVFQIAAGARASVEVLEGLAKSHHRRTFMSGGMVLYNEADPGRATGVLDQCERAREGGSDLYAHVACQPLSMNFTAADPYPFYSYPAFLATRTVDEAGKAAIYADSSFRDAFRQQLKTPIAGAAFSGNWDRILISQPINLGNADLEDISIAEIARRRGTDPIDTFFNLSLEEELQTGFVGHLFNAVDNGVSKILRHSSGVIALSDAGAHLSFLCDAAYGLHFLGHWVRERGDFDLVEGVRRLTSQPADLYGIPDRGRIVVGAYADLMLFDPASIGMSKLIRVNDLPAGAMRNIRQPTGVHGVWVNGTRIFDNGRTLDLAKGPGQVLSRFN